MEELKQKISPDATIDKFIKYVANHNYAEVKVIDVHELGGNGGAGKVVDEIEVYQARINAVLKPAEQVGAQDYKKLYEQQVNKLNSLESNMTEIIQSKIDEALKWHKESDKNDNSNDSEELTQAKVRYEQLYGKKPNGKMLLEKMQQKIKEKELNK